MRAALDEPHLKRAPSGSWSEQEELLLDRRKADSTLGSQLPLNCRSCSVRTLRCANSAGKDVSEPNPLLDEDSLAQRDSPAASQAANSLCLSRRACNTRSSVVERPFVRWDELMLVAAAPPNQSARPSGRSLVPEAPALGHGACPPTRRRPDKCFEGRAPSRRRPAGQRRGAPGILSRCGARRYGARGRCRYRGPDPRRYLHALTPDGHDAPSVRDEWTESGS